MFLGFLKELIDLVDSSILILLDGLLVAIVERVVLNIVVSRLIEHVNLLKVLLGDTVQLLDGVLGEVPSLLLIRVVVEVNVFNV